MGIRSLDDLCRTNHFMTAIGLGGGDGGRCRTAEEEEGLNYLKNTPKNPILIGVLSIDVLIVY